MADNFNDIISSLEELEQRADTTSIGELIASRIGVGIEQSSYLAVTSLENVYVELETLYKNADKNIRALQKKTQERELSNLKNALKLNFITEQEYYERLLKYRDENLRQGTDAWYKYTEEIVLYNKRMADQLEAEQKALAEKLLSMRDTLAGKLSEDESPWYTNNTIVIKGIGKNGTDVRYHNTDISSFDKEIGLINQYREAILALKALGNIPSGVFSDINSMDIKDGLAAANAILNASTQERARFIEGYNTRLALSENVANQLTPILNSEDIAQLASDASDVFNNSFFTKDSDGKTSFIKILEESFADIPLSYHTLGNSSASSFGEGFMQTVPAVMEEIRSYVLSEASSIAAQLSSAFRVYTVGSPQGAGNTYNNKYIFNSSRDTTTEQLLAAQRETTLARLRGM